MLPGAEEAELVRPLVFASGKSKPVVINPTNEGQQGQMDCGCWIRRMGGRKPAGGDQSPLNPH